MCWFLMDQEIEFKVNQLLEDEELQLTDQVFSKRKV